MAVKPSYSAKTVCSSPSSSVRISKEVEAETLLFFSLMGFGIPVPDKCNTHGFYSHFLPSFIISERGESLALFSPNLLSNGFGTLHGGAVGSLVEVLSTACARTVVADDKELFLREISISYLSGTLLNEEVVANASVVKTGRNLTVVTLEFKLKKTGNVLYIAHATFYNMPVASL